MVIARLGACSQACIRVGSPPDIGRASRSVPQEVRAHTSVTGSPPLLCGQACLFTFRVARASVARRNEKVASGHSNAAGQALAKAGKGATDMPEVTINLVEGRTVEQKRELARRMTDLMVEVLKVDPSAIIIVFNENRREDKAKGGVLFLDR
jgi:4-oxalocrotonate tautomerase